MFTRLNNVLVNNFFVKFIVRSKVYIILIINIKVQTNLKPLYDVLSKLIKVKDV
jgi:hypothetical protein